MDRENKTLEIELGGDVMNKKELIYIVTLTLCFAKAISERLLSGGRKKYKCATDICFNALTKLFNSFSLCLIMATKESDFYEYKCYSKIFAIPA